MSFFQDIFGKAKDILSNGKEAVVTPEPNQSKLPTLPKFPYSPSTFNPSVTALRQSVKANPPVVRDPLEIIRKGKEQFISQGTPEPKKVLNTGIFTGLFSGTGRSEMPSRNFDNKSFIEQSIEGAKRSVREKGLVPAVGDFLFEGFNKASNPDIDQYLERVNERANILTTKFDITPEEAQALAKQDIYNLSSFKDNQTLAGPTKVPQRNLGLELTQEQEKALSGVHLKEKAFAVVDAPMFLGSTKPVSKLAKLRLKRAVTAKDLAGNKFEIPLGSKLEPIEDNNKYIFKVDGKDYAVNKNQYENIKGQSDVAEARPFAPELDDTVETVKGQNMSTKGTGALEKVQPTIDRTKYSQYTLPGGKDYSEIVVQAPVKKDFTGFKIEKVEYDDGVRYFASHPNGRSNALKTRAEAEKSLEKYKDTYGDIQVDNTAYKSSHWEEPNPLFHIRRNTRDWNGKKVEFMEEAQSDWARDGREKGFLETPEYKKNKTEREALQKERASLIAKYDPENNNLVQARRNMPDDVRNREYDISNRLADLAELPNAVPNHPLLKNWQIPATKRALLEAVDRDADIFAWINGAQTSERYKLSTQVESVKWNKDSMGNKGIILTPKENNTGGYLSFTIEDSGKIITTGNGVPGDWKGKKLDEVLGKGMADSIMSKPTGTLEGEGLNFGGEWANNLYDKQIRDIVKKLTGAEVKKADMGLALGKNDKFTLNDGNDAGGFVEKRNLNVGLDISDSKGVGYIVTEVGEGGKFKAVQKSSLDEGQKGYGLPSFIAQLRNGNPNILTEVRKYEKEFDIGPKVQTQQYIELTPEVKARIRSEAPKFKLSVPDTDSIPLIYRTLLNVENADSTIAKEVSSLNKIFGVDNVVIKGVPVFDEAGKLGEMKQGIIRLLETNGKVSEAVAKHEGWHLFKTGMVTKAERQVIIQMEQELLAKFPNKADKLRKAGYKEWELAEELMADEFSRYYRTGQTFSQKLAVIFDKIIQRLELMFKKKTEVLDYFKNVSSKTTGEIKGNASVRSKKLSPIDHLIALNKVRVVSRDGKDIYQVKKGDVWRNARDEDSAIKQASPKKLSAEGIPLSTRKLDAKRKAVTVPDELESRLVAAQVAKEALDADPAKELAKFASKTGENKGTLKEVTGQAKGKFANRGDDIITELGFKDSEQARQAYDEYVTRKVEVMDELSQAQASIKAYKQQAKTAPKSPLQSVTQTRGTSKLKGGEAKSLEELAQQQVEALDLPRDVRPVSLDKIVPQTPVTKKVNFLDYIRTPDRVLNKIGFGKEARMLRNQYEKYAIELPKNIDTITAWTKRVPKQSNERLFRYLDGEDIKLTATEQKVADEMRDYLKTWADRLNLPEDKRVTNYITRLFEDTLIQKEFDEDLAKIIRDRVPGEVYNPFLEKRLGAKGYKKDVWKALDAYTKRATRKVHMDPALERIQEKAGASLEFSPLEESQYQYIKRYLDRVQMRPTELDNSIDNFVKSTVGYRLGQRPVAHTSRLLRQMTYRGMLGGNLSSAMRNLSQGINTYATLGEKYTAIGYAKLFNRNSYKEALEQGIFGNNFIEDRALSATKQTLQKFDKGIWYFFDRAERINRGAAYFGAKAKGLSKGMNEAEAIEYAKSIVRKTQFAYDAVDTPVVLGSDIVKTFAQFQTFTTKQIEFLTEMVKDKNVAGLLRYAISGIVFVNTIGRAFGMEEKELAPWYRFDVPPSLKFPWEVVKAGFDTEDKYGNKRDFEQKAKDIGKAGIGLIPAGNQIKKTIQGAEAIEKGGSFDSAGRLQFEQEDTPARKAQTLLFGKYANPNAKEYFDKKTDSGDKELDKAIKADREKSAEVNEQATILTKELAKLPPEDVPAQLKELAKTDKELALKVRDRLRDIQKKKTWSKADEGIAKLGVQNGARASYVYGKAKSLGSEAGNAYIKDLHKRGVISDEVLKQIKDLAREDDTINK